MKGPESRTKISRRAFFGVVLGGGTLAAILPNAPDDIRRAVQAHRKAAGKFVEIETDYELHAPELAGDVRAMRQLEDRLQRSLGSLNAASDAILDALEAAGLDGVVEGDDLFIAAWLEPEGVRRLVMVPTTRIRGL